MYATSRYDWTVREEGGQVTPVPQCLAVPIGSSIFFSETRQTVEALGSSAQHQCHTHKQRGEEYDSLRVASIQDSKLKPDPEWEKRKHVRYKSETVERGEACNEELGWRKLRWDSPPASG